jgi:hypothetical protein
VLCAKSQSPICDLARMLWLGEFSQRNLLVMLYAAYFDVSGEPVGYPVFTVGGAVAPIKKWIRFERDWKLALAKEGIKQFHATDFAASQGEFKDWKDDKTRRSAFMRALVNVIRSNVNRLFMVNVEIDAWKEVNREYLLEEVFHSPFALCGYTAIKDTLKWSKRKGIRSPIKFVFEEGDDGWDGLKKLVALLNVVPIRLPKEHARPCEASDLIAWKSRIACTNGLRKLNKILVAVRPNPEGAQEVLDELRSLENILVRPGKPGVYSSDALRDTCKKSGIPKRPSLTIRAI